MSERITAQDARTQFHRLRRAMGKRHASDYPWRDPQRIGAWDLDSNPGYGGYVIEEQMNDGGGIRHPFGSQRRNASEFVEAIFFAFEVMRELDAEKEPPLVQAILDDCPHVPHLHINENFESGDGRYVRHTHSERKSTANLPASPDHEHAEFERITEKASA